MRPKFIFAILLAAILVVVAIFFKKNSSMPVSIPPTAIASVTPAPEPMPEPAPVVVKKTMTPEGREAAVNAEKDKLDAWSMNNDSQSLSNILGDLVSPEKEIRM